MTAPRSSPMIVTTDERIMYVCSECADDSPEGCGHFNRENLRVTDDGRWLCDACFDNDFPNRRGVDDERCWSDFPVPPEYLPATPSAPGDVAEIVREMEWRGEVYSPPPKMEKFKQWAAALRRCSAGNAQPRDETLRGLAEFFEESEHHVWSKDEVADCLRGMITDVEPSSKL